MKIVCKSLFTKADRFGPNFRSKNFKLKNFKLKTLKFKHPRARRPTCFDAVVMRRVRGRGTVEDTAFVLLKLLKAILAQLVVLEV